MQSHLKHCQASWVKHISPYQLRIKYKPRKELVMADTLSHLYIAFITGDNGLDPDWPMFYLHPEATCYKGLNSVTISKLKDNKIQFITNAGVAASLITPSQEINVLSRSPNDSPNGSPASQ
ncbi:hypothetical protein DSO57_1016887 [Entomophthora muscae]|uniref:Uncharacterized protein n=1 Tax=Entomophthora muscae TaxID=34485 RepID=A0ACC2SHJ5_9FUNG|nr:hypothetical protein DSO57_1016887 [Entomophthora muscae]